MKVLILFFVMLCAGVCAGVFAKDSKESAKLALKDSNLTKNPAPTKNLENLKTSATTKSTHAEITHISPQQKLATKNTKYSQSSLRANENIDFNEYAMFTPINNIHGTQVLDRFSSEVVNALDIPAKYIATMHSEGRLIDFNDKAWGYLVKRFDKRYEYVPLLRKMLLEAGVPQEFLFLAMIESGFDSKALSNKSAAGVWQIIPSTAREMGLVIDEYIDERLDVVKSTAVAIKYLQTLHKMTGKWYLAAMAYNCGIGRLKRGIKEAKSDDIAILLDESGKYVPPETRNYMRKIMSVSLAFSNASVLKQMDKEYMLNRGAADSIIAVDVKAGNSLENIAEGARMDVESLREYNRQFRQDFVPLDSEVYQVYLPYDRLSYFRQNFKDSFDTRLQISIYNVKKGDTLALIAEQNNISVERIKSANNLSGDSVRVKQRLVLPRVISRVVARKGG